MVGVEEVLVVTVEVEEALVMAVTHIMDLVEVVEALVVEEAALEDPRILHVHNKTPFWVPMGLVNIVYCKLIPQIWKLDTYCINFAP